MAIASIHTLGCRLNQADSALLAAELSAMNVNVVTWGMPSDIIIINSCAVTGIASRKSRQAAAAARRAHPNAFIVMVGCDVSVEGDILINDGLADMAISNPKPTDCAKIILDAFQRHASRQLIRPAPLKNGFVLNCHAGNFLDKSRANIKIQEGCDFRCTYCIVPDTRGHAVSRDWQDILSETKSLVEAGFKELVITGVNIATYYNHGLNLVGLLKKMLNIAPTFRIRLGSTESGGPIIPELIDFMKDNSRICRFLHLPIQYGENCILQRMGRHYSADEFKKHAQLAVQEIPGLCLGTDIIVGFPGETDEIFTKCVDYVKSMPFGLMHVFIYSPRPGTPAAGWKDKPNASIAKHRSEMLLQISAQKAEDFAMSQLHAPLPVLIENFTGKIAHGWSDNYLKVFADTEKYPLVQNDLVTLIPQKHISGRELEA